ncbi:MAG TPA: hypothetical protein VF807_06715 [Ktedonobacterales bacterium]
MYPHHPFEGGHPGMFGLFMLIRLAVFAIFWLIPVIIGLTYVRADAKRRGQPGWLWALASVFLGWIAVLTYLIVRAFTSQQPPTQYTMPPPQPMAPPPPPELS